MRHLRGGLRRLRAGSTGGNLPTMSRRLPPKLVLTRADLVRMLATAKPGHANKKIDLEVHEGPTGGHRLKFTAGVSMPDKDTFHIELEEPKDDASRDYDDRDPG